MPFGQPVLDTITTQPNGTTNLIWQATSSVTVGQSDKRTLGQPDSRTVAQRDSEQWIAGQQLHGQSVGQPIQQATSMRRHTTARKHKDGQQCRAFDRCQTQKKKEEKRRRNNNNNNNNKSMSLRCLTQSRKTAGHNYLSEGSQLVVVHLHCKAGSGAAPRRDRNWSTEKTCAAPLLSSRPVRSFTSSTLTLAWMHI